MPATTYQQKVIDKISGPTIVLAGAGSGKTHTMCERIVSAIEKGRAGNKSCPSSINEVVAITFTNKAAGELKSRIRTLLNDRNLISDAREVDDAFISTIHGFASRILRENALTFGVDPLFKLLSDFKDKIERKLINDDIRNDVATGNIFKDDENPDLSLLMLATFLSEDNNDDFDKFFKLVKGRCTSQVDGLNKLKLVQPKMTPIEIIGTLSGYFHRAISIYESLEKPTEKCLKYLSLFRESLNKSNEFLNSLNSPDEIFVDIESLNKETTDLIFSFPCKSGLIPPKSKITDDEYKFFEEYRTTLSRCVLSHLIFVRLGANLAIRPYAELYDFYQRQHLSNFQFTNDTLLKYCCESLKAHPEIAMMYQDKFKMIIVDEFQDTDKVQIDLINLISKQDFDNVCTVGDIQQSIYAFRGADVNAFREYRDDVLKKNKNTEVFEMPNNFRSHKEIISFVEHIFSSPNMFGDEFLRLSSNSPINNIKDPIFDNADSNILPRVSVDVMHGSRNKDGKKFLTDDLVNRSAKKIALHFKELQNRGAKPGNMALLLGTTKRLRIYRRALAEVGIDSIVTGGSDFAKSEEPKLMLNVLKILENANDEMALCEILKSKLFSIDDTGLMYITHRFDDKSQKYKNIGLSAGFYSFDSNWKSYPISENEFNKLCFARDAIKNLLVGATCIDPISAIRLLLLRTGVVDNMDDNKSEGLPEAGNFEKSFNIIRQIMSDDTRGIAGIARDFELFLESGKEKPSIYSSEDSNYLQIMTIHASKGLQFDHVAVTEIDDGLPPRGGKNMYSECINDNIYYCIKESLSTVSSNTKQCDFVGYDQVRECDFGTTIDDDLTETFLTIQKKHDDDALAEARRKLYVALTRAVKSVSLYLYLGSKYSQKDGYTKKGIINDLYSSLKWLPEGIRSTQNLNYGGDQLGVLTFECLPFSDEVKQTDEIELEFEKIRIDNTSKSSTFKVYPDYKPVATEYFAPPSKEGNIHSYSSLLKAVNDPDNEATSEKPGYDPELYESIARESNESATTFGTEFHIVMQADLLAIPNRPDCQALSKRCQNAIDVWNKCSEKVKLHSYNNVFAEHEFSAKISVDGRTEYLIGEVDAISYNDKRHAYVVDYKTGAFAHDHTLQAAVYTYALLRSGFESVELDFVHVEIVNKRSGSPYSVNFKYKISDLPELDKIISSAIRKTYQ